MIDAYLKLAVATLLPVGAAVILFLLDRRTAFGKLNEKLKQVIYGVMFGALAVLGTEWGIPMNGAQMNCRDAAVLIAGLMFGAPAGIIAGLIGGIERWFAVYWGVGSFTRVACTISTIFAGFYAAALRRHMFEDKKPGILISLAIGVVMEVLHLTMVFITNMDTPTEAMTVVRACTAPMISANGISVFLSAAVLSLLARDKTAERHRGIARISQTIQRWLLITVMLAFAATSCFVFGLQNRIATTQADTQLELSVNEVSADILDASDRNLLLLCRRVASIGRAIDLNMQAVRYDLAEISLVDKNGIITDSTNPDFIGFDMASGEQSAEFLCLLGDTEEYVQSYGPITYDPSISRKYAGVKTANGFVQVGYDASQFQTVLKEEIVGAAKNRHVGQNGYVLILDEAYNVVSAPDWIMDNGRIDAEAFDELPEQNTTFSVRIEGEDCLSRLMISEGYIILSVLPVSEAYQMRNIALYVNTFMEILVFAVLFGLIYLLIKRVVVNQIKTINQSLAKITGGDLNEVVNVRSNEEFASLSDDINTTVDTLKHYIDEASARIDQELEFAKNIQASALPSVFPAFPKRKDFDIYALMDPAKEVGGDFYDFYMTNTDVLHFLVADVSGKGIPAAMFMMRAKTELKSLTETEMDLADVFTHGNDALCEGNDAGMFVTAWQGTINLTDGTVRFANAGHTPPLVCRNGQFEYLRSRAGFVLAGMDGIRYRTQEFKLEPGDTVYLYTDGVTEATNAQSELFGEERLLNAVNSRPFDSVRELCDFVKAEVDSFVGDAPQFDDITMVALRYFGQPVLPSVHFDKAAIADIPVVTEFVEKELEKRDLPMKTVFQINVAIDEIYSNIVKYAYPNRTGPVTVSVLIKDDPQIVYIKFVDNGIPYNPLTKADPDISLSADERTIGGLGIYMVKKTMDDMKYKYEDGQNILTIQKRF